MRTRIGHASSKVAQEPEAPQAASQGPWRAKGVNLGILRYGGQVYSLDSGSFDPATRPVGVRATLRKTKTLTEHGHGAAINEGGRRNCR